MSQERPIPSVDCSEHIFNKFKADEYQGDAEVKTFLYEALQVADIFGEGEEECACVEIVCEDQSLFIIYYDLDGWLLGHSGSVGVVSSRDGLNPDWSLY